MATITFLLLEVHQIFETTLDSRCNRVIVAAILM
jgi:hypothetical protein